jgi:hypothetical protein
MHCLELATIIKMFGNSNDIAGAAPFDELGDRPKDKAMVFSVQIFCRNNVGNLVPGLSIEHQATNQGLFRFYGVRRYLEALFSPSVCKAIVHRSDHLYSLNDVLRPLKKVTHCPLRVMPSAAPIIPRRRP